MSKIETMGKLREVVVVNSIGTKRMTFRTQMTREESFEALNEQGRVFKLEMRSWNAETGETEIDLVPANGVMVLYEYYEPPKEAASPALPPEVATLGETKHGKA